MEISESKLLLMAILSTYTGSCSGGGSYGGRTTPKEEPTTLRPDGTGPTPATCNSSLECLDHRYAPRPSLWKNQKTILSLPNFHGYKASEPLEVQPDGSVIIQNEVKTNLGNWLDWKECPAGMYAMGYQGFLIGSEQDHAGVYYINFLCRTPGGNETNRIIEACTPNLCPSNRPGNAGKKSKVCKGTIVGFSLLVPEPRRNKTDYIGTEAFEGSAKRTDLRRCSVKLPAHEEIFGKAKNYGWSKFVHCDKYQAMCGFQVQMQDYKPTRDNTAMNNLKIKCCHVPDPLKECVPAEERVFIRICDNFDGAESLRCDFVSRIGLSVDYENEKALMFYFSIGYDFFSIQDKMKEKIFSKLRNDRGNTLEYSWDTNSINCNVERSETSSIKTVCVGPHESVELYQIVGKCGYFWIRTDRFVKVITKNGKESVEYVNVY